jgi:hypothetical protein
MQVTVKTYLIAKPASEWDSEKGKYVETVEFFPWPYESYSETTALTSQEISFEVPDGINAHDLKLQELFAQKTKLQAEFGARITEIQAQINQLTAIEG